MDEGEDDETVDALRARHPGWRITRPWYCGREYWKASRPGLPAVLLRRGAGELGEAIGAVEREWQS